MMKQILITATTDSGGDANVTLHQIVGVVHSIEVLASGLAGTALVTVSITDRGVAGDKALLTLPAGNNDKEYFVRELAQGDTGADLAAEYAKPVAVGKAKVVIASGGATNTAKVIINYHDP